MLPTALLLLATSAPVPRHLMPDPAPVGTVIPYGDSAWLVKEVRWRGDAREYRLADPDTRNEWRGRWVTERDVRRTLADRWAKWLDGPLEQP